MPARCTEAQAAGTLKRNNGRLRKATGYAAEVLADNLPTGIVVNTNTMPLEQVFLWPAS